MLHPPCRRTGDRHNQESWSVLKRRRDRRDGRPLHHRRALDKDDE